MTIGSDFSVAANGDIRLVGGTANYTVLELHRWLQDLADDAAASGDDYIDITKATPSSKSYDTIIELVNGYNIDDALSQRLYGGSVIQGGGAVIYDGLQVLAPAGMYLQIVQNNALATNFWTTGINADASNGISHQFLLKVRTGAADIDGRRLLGMTREWGKSYAEFKVNGTSRGVNVMAFTGWMNDLNNTTLEATIAGYTDITNVTAGYNGIDVNADATDEYFYSEWNRAAHSINDLYERMKYITRRGETATLYGLQGQLFRGITHEVAVTTPRTGSVAEGVSASWTGGTGQVLARDSAGTATKLWLQLLTGVAPTAGQTITIGAATVTAAAGTPSTERSVSAPFCGPSTGTSLIGAYGFGVEATDLGVADKVFDLTNTQFQPPNYVTFIVSGIVSGEDYVLVGPALTGELQVGQLTLNGALTGAAVTSVVVNESIPTDTPLSGTVRIRRANGAYTRHPYSAYNAGTKTFTITAHDFSTNNADNGANCFISYIDKLADATTASFQASYAADRSLFVRIRDGGGSPIKTFESTATLGSSGGSVNAIRTSDA